MAAGMWLVIILLESAIIFAVHSMLSWIRPAARDRNLVGQGFADPNHPGPNVVCMRVYVWGALSISDMSLGISGYARRVYSTWRLL